MDTWYERQGTPRFSKPPVIETVLGIRFSPDPQMTLVDVAQLQSKWIQKYPVFSHAVVDPNQAIKWQPGVPVSMNPMEIRFWAQTPDGQGLVQSQVNHMVLNWRKTLENITYPGFESQLAEFKSLWANQLDWAKDKNWEMPNPYEVEVTYVNDLGAIDSDALKLNPFLALGFKPLPGRNTELGYKTEHVLDTSDGHPYQGVLRVSLDTLTRNTNRAHLILACTALLLVSPSDDFVEAIESGHALATHAFANAITATLAESYGLRK